MAGGKGKIHEHPNANTNGFDKNPQNRGKGRNPSIKNQLKDLMSSEGGVTIPETQVKKINEDGSVVIKMPTQMQLAMKLVSWAMGKKGNDSIKAIQMIMEQLDGKPKQTIEESGEKEVTVKIVREDKGL